MLAIVLRRFKRLYGCNYAVNHNDAPCVHCGVARSVRDVRVNALRKLAYRPRSDRSARALDHNNLREAILCPARTPPPASLSIFDLATPEQFRALDLPFNKSGLDRRTISALAREGYTHLGHAYHRLDGNVEHHLSYQADKGRVAKNAFTRVMELYVSLALAEEGEYPTWRERMLADREHGVSAAKAQLIGLFLPRPPARTLSRNDVFVHAGDHAGDFSFLDCDISDIDLTVRAHNTLRHAGMHTLRDIVTHTERDLRRTKNFGDKTIAEIKRLLDSINLELGMSFDPDGRPRTCAGAPARLIPRPADDMNDGGDYNWVM